MKTPIILIFLLTGMVFLSAQEFGVVGMRDSVVHYGFCKVVRQGDVYAAVDPFFNPRDPRVKNAPESPRANPLVSIIQGTASRNPYFGVKDREILGLEINPDVSPLRWDWLGDEWLFSVQEIINFDPASNEPPRYIFSGGLRAVKVDKKANRITFGEGRFVWNRKEKENKEMSNYITIFQFDTMYHSNFYGQVSKWDRPIWSYLLLPNGNYLIPYQNSYSFKLYESSRVYNEDDKPILHTLDVLPSPFDFIVSKKGIFLLLGVGDVLLIREGELAKVGDLRDMPNWKKSKEELCFYIVDRERQITHFLWGDDGYAYLEEYELRPAPMPSELREVYQALRAEIPYVEK